MATKANKQSFTDILIDKITLMAEPLGRFAQTPIVSSIQSGMAAAMPLTIIGSLFLIIGAATDGGIGFAPLSFLAPWAGDIYLMFNIGMGFMALYIALGCGISYAEKLGVPQINAALLVVASFIAFSFDSFAEGMPVANFGVGSMFPAMVCSLVSVKLFSIFLNKNLVIKMPDTVPASVANSFTSLIPYAVIVIMWWIVRTILGFDFNAFMATIVSPLLNQADSLWAYTLDRIFSGLFWSCGIHYDNMVSAIKGTLMTQWTLENAAFVEAYGTSQVLPHIWTYAIDNWATKAGYAWPVVAYLLTSKAPGMKQIGVSVFLPVFFCIIEPLWFSIPAILNPYLMFGITASTIASGVVTYIMFMLNICTRPFVIIPWACPDILGGFLTTGGDWRFLIILVVNFLVGLVVWFPFWKAWERKLFKDEEERLALEAQANLADSE